GSHYLFAGRKADFADGTNNRIPSNVLYPSIGSVVSRELGARGSVPVYVNVPHPLSAGGPGFYGAEHAPFVIEADPVQPDFEVKDLSAAEGLSAARQARRRQTLGALEAPRKPAQSRSQTLAKYYEKAYDLVTSADAHRAF